MLPFPDLMFDRILLVHGLEAAENARGPAARGLARPEGRRPAAGGGAEPARHVGALESTPFGHGQPYSAGQVGRLLAATLFRVERARHGAL